MKKPQIKDQLQEMLQYLFKSIKNAEGFAKEQLPDVVQQYVRAMLIKQYLKFATVAFLLILGLSLVGLGVFVFIEEGGKVVSIGAGIALFIGGCVLAYETTMIYIDFKVSPKAEVLDYLMDRISEL